MRNIKKIIIHCSASDNKNHDSIAVIRRWHKAKGYKDVGYHYFINKLGRIEQGRPLEQIGAHVRGHNRDSIGICLSGLNHFTDKQRESLKKLLKTIKKLTSKNLPVYPHNKFTKKKTCPNFDIEKFLNGNLEIIKQY